MSTLMKKEMNLKISILNQKNEVDSILSICGCTIEKVADGFYIKLKKAPLQMNAAVSLYYLYSMEN